MDIYTPDSTERPLRSISLFSGIGALDIGFRIGAGRVGIDTRTVLYIERELEAIALLRANMEKGYLDDAPVFTDITKFDGKPFRGAVDCLVGGFPCQPYSIAGQGKGENDERNLWPEIERLIREIGPTVLFFENVGQLTAYEYFWDEILGFLGAHNFATQFGFFSASETGAPHLRKRVFILAIKRE